MMVMSLCRETMRELVSGQIEHVLGGRDCEQYVSVGYHML